MLWLAPTGIAQSLTSSTGAVLMSKGRSGMLLMLGILGMLLMISAFIIGVQFDITTLTMLYFFANVVNFIPAMTITMRLLEGVSLRCSPGLSAPHFVQESCARHCIGCNTLHRWVSPSIISSR